ncbi:HutD/Ves family protein [Frigidibacter sp. MR17.24]|uniref:HutD/Ves family protein n=1 Tax=Frigidibacter sp. MR17.24 TaxID=3127345 RepID=UPI003012ECD7
MRHLPADGYAEQPWVNGGGVTREIARAASPEPAAPFDWRLSMAPVMATGPFSTFPGIDRTLTVIEGAGLVLAIGTDEAEVLLPGRPFAFPGDVPTHAALIEGPITDLNVMTRRGAFAHSVTPARDPAALQGPGAVFALEPMQVDGVMLGRFDTLMLDPGDEVATGPGACLLIRLEAVTT